MRRLSCIVASLLVLVAPVVAAPSASAASGPVPDFTNPLCANTAETPPIFCIFHGTATGGGQIVSWDWDFAGESSGHASGQNPVRRFHRPGPVDVTLTVVDDQNRTGTVTKPVMVRPGVWPFGTP